MSRDISARCLETSHPRAQKESNLRAASPEPRLNKCAIASERHGDRSDISGGLCPRTSFLLFAYRAHPY
jgi:hypothetical protein